MIKFDEILNWPCGFGFVRPQPQWTDSVCFVCACLKTRLALCTTWLSPCFSLCPPLLLALFATIICPPTPHSPLSRPAFPPPFPTIWFAGIFHHVAPTVSSHQFGAALPASGGLGSLLSLSSSSSSQTQQRTSPQPPSTRLTSGSSPLPLSQAQHSRTQSVLHSPSPPTLSLPPPPPLHSAPSSSSAPTHSDAPPSSRSDPLYASRLSHSSLHHQRAQSSLSLSISSSASVSAAAAATASLSSSSLSTSSSSRPFTVHYSPRLPPPPPATSSGGGGSMWRTQGMHGNYITSQLPGSRPR